MFELREVERHRDRETESNSRLCDEISKLVLADYGICIVNHILDIDSSRNTGQIGRCELFEQSPEALSESRRPLSVQGKSLGEFVPERIETS